MQHKHPNGGGVIRGDQAVVSPSVFLSEEAAVMHGAHVAGGARLEGRTGVGGTAVVVDSIVIDSTIGKVLTAEESYRVDGQLFQPNFPFVVNAYVAGRSRIENQFILGHPEEPVRLWNCWLEDASQVRDTARLSHTHLLHHATICGDASVIGEGDSTITLDRRHYVHTGEWIIAPKYFEVGDDTDPAGIHVGITECVAGRVNVGCFCVEIEKLLDHIENHGTRSRLARRYGWQGYHLDRIHEGLTRWQKETN